MDPPSLYGSFLIWQVLLSDVDVIWLANPFNFLVRDSDVEGMSDGWDDTTTFGWDYAGAAPAHSSRTFISAIYLGEYSSRRFISAKYLGAYLGDYPR